MRIVLILGMLSGLVLCALPATAAEVYTIDTSHTSLVFSVRHLVVSKVRGTFNELGGTVTYDPEAPSRSAVDVQIAAASIDTRNDDRDKHLRSEDFFDVANHPAITFSSERVERAGERWIVHGTVTIRGVSKPLSIPFQVNGPITDPRGNRRLGVESEPVTINRKDFGVSWNRVLDTGGLTVGDEVEIELDVEAVVHAAEKPAA